MLLANSPDSRLKNMAANGGRKERGVEEEKGREIVICTSSPFPSLLSPLLSKGEQMFSGCNGRRSVPPFQVFFSRQIHFSSFGLIFFGKKEEGIGETYLSFPLALRRLQNEKRVVR